MKILYLAKIKKSISGKCSILLNVCFPLLLFSMVTWTTPVLAQGVLFDFDNAPLLSPLPIDQSVGGITAHFSATPPGYSIQEANVHGFVPAGFSGYILDPSSINLSDLFIRFDQALTDFSIMYSCQELGCDDAATMRVTAFMNGSLVGTNTKIATNPGTWPVDTLRCSFMQGFDSVVVHYDKRPPTCQDYGVIFMADNMRVTTLKINEIREQKIFIQGPTIPNPISGSATISFSLLRPENISVTIYDAKGKLITRLYNGSLNSGEHRIKWNVNKGTVISGLYFLNIKGESFSQSSKLVVVK